MLVAALGFHINCDAEKSRDNEDKYINISSSVSPSADVVFKILARATFNATTTVHRPSAIYPKSANPRLVDDLHFIEFQSEGAETPENEIEIPSENEIRNA